MLASKQVLETGADEDAGRAGDGRAAARGARHHVPLPARDRGRRGPHAHRALDPRHDLAPRLAAADRARRDRARQPDDALPHRRPARRGAADQPRGRRRRPARRARRGDRGRRRAARAHPRAAQREPRRTPRRAARRRRCRRCSQRCPALEALAEGLRRDAPGPSRVSAREPRSDRAPHVRGAREPELPALVRGPGHLAGRHLDADDRAGLARLHAERIGHASSASSSRCRWCRC